METGLVTLCEALAKECESLELETLATETCVELLSVLSTTKLQLEGVRTAVIGHLASIERKRRESRRSDSESEPGPDAPPGAVKGKILGESHSIWESVERTGKQSPKKVGQEVRRAQAVHELYPGFGQAMRAGKISGDYVDVLQSAFRSGELKERAAQAEGWFLERALAQPVEQFRKSVQAWKFRNAPRSAEAQAKQDAQSEIFRVSREGGGYRLSGWLGPINGAIVRQVIGQAIGVPSRDDERSPGQRGADALLHIVHLATARELVRADGELVRADGQLVQAGEEGARPGEEILDGEGQRVRTVGSVGGVASKNGSLDCNDGGQFGGEGQSDGGELGQSWELQEHSWPGPVRSASTSRSVSTPLTQRVGARYQMLVHVPLATLVQTERAIQQGCSHLDHLEQVLQGDGLGSEGERRNALDRSGLTAPRVSRVEGDPGMKGYPESLDHREPRLEPEPDSNTRREAHKSPFTALPSCPVSGYGIGGQGRCLDGRESLTTEIGHQLGRVKAFIKAGVCPDALEDFEPATLTDGTPLAPSQLARMMCSSGISRIVFSAHGEPLDASRSQRRFSSTQEKAIISRDRSCRYPGCGRGLDMCEIHHAHTWHDGGATTTDNGLLLCFHHHQYIHSEHIVITHHAGGFVFTRPNGSVVGIRRNESAEGTQRCGSVTGPHQHENVEGIKRPEKVTGTRHGSAAHENTKPKEGLVVSQRAGCMEGARHHDIMAEIQQRENAVREAQPQDLTTTIQEGLFDMSV